MFLLIYVISKAHIAFTMKEQQQCLPLGLTSRINEKTGTADSPIVHEL